MPAWLTVPALTGVGDLIPVSGRWGRQAKGRAPGVARFQVSDLAPIALQRGEYLAGLPQLLWVCLGSACLLAVGYVAVEPVHLGDQAQQLLLQGRERRGVGKRAGPGKDLFSFSALGLGHAGQRVRTD